MSSGISTWPVTFAMLAESAARELGAIGMGDTPSAAEMEEMQTRFNMLLRSWAITANLWRAASGTITIPAGTGAVTLPAEIRDIMGVGHVASATNTRGLTQWNRDQFMGLPNRAQSGSPSIYYFAKPAAGAGGQLFVWPVPPADADFELDYSRGAYVVTAPAETLDLPEEWAETALYNLASRCAGIFGAARLDPANTQRVDSKAAALFGAMLDADRPDSYQFYYDSPVEAY